MAVVCQRSHHRGNPFLDKATEHLTVSAVHIAHKAKVDESGCSGGSG